MDVNIAFVAKNNNIIFHVIPLQRLLRARHGDIPSSYWVVINVVKSDVKIMTMFAHGARGMCLIL